jgi:hypothetical protein
MQSGLSKKLERGNTETSPEVYSCRTQINFADVLQHRCTSWSADALLLQASEAVESSQQRIVALPFLLSFGFAALIQSPKTKLSTFLLRKAYERRCGMGQGVEVCQDFSE